MTHDSFLGQLKRRTERSKLLRLLFDRVVAESGNADVAVGDDGAPLRTEGSGNARKREGDESGVFRAQ